MDAQNRYKTPPHILEEVSGNRVLITIEVKGLQKKSKNEAKNATITKEFDESSICIQIDGTKGKMEGKHFQLKSKKLPGEIDPNKCTLKLVDDNFVEVHLMKADKEPWNMKKFETQKEDIKDEK